QGTPPSDCPDGYRPLPALIQASNGDLYGTTLGGGANHEGSVFKITTGGSLTTLYSFCSLSGCVDGIQPYGPLFQACNGDFYGTTTVGGANGYGTVFEITPAGKLTTLYSFCSVSACADGSSPRSTLIQATDGNLYGTTEYGGYF